VLQKYGDWVELTEPCALALYREDRRGAADYILRHLPWRRRLWSELSTLALELGDEEFHHRLYRRQVPVKSWRRDVLALAEKEKDPETLVRELERRHPEGGYLNLAGIFHQLVEQRGRDVMPYVLAFNREAVEEECAYLARVLALPGTGFDAFLEWVLALRAELGIPETLAELGVDAARADEIGEMAARDAAAAGNPRPVDAADLRGVFVAATEGGT